MVALRSRRLESLFGASLDQLTVANVRSLVEVAAQEAFDLDFKAAPYGRGDSDRRALAGDVAALANTAGGVIVIGVEEDDQARAAAAPGIDVTDAEVARIRQVVASLVSPLPLFDVVMVSDEEDEAQADEGPEGAVDPADAMDRVDADDSAAATPTQGFLVIAVPRSPSAPHAVLVNDGLRYPKRNGATTRYLSEPEVAQAYRDRRAGAASQVARLDEVEREASNRLDRSAPWLLVTLDPDLPGDLLINQTVLQQFQQQTVGGLPGIPGLVSVQYQRTSVGRRRLLADGGAADDGSARWASLEVHADGAASFGVQLFDANASNRQSAASVNEMVDDEAMVAGILSGLIQLPTYSRDLAAAGGGVLLRVRILPSREAQTVEMGHFRHHGFGESRSRQPVDAREPVWAEASADLDDLVDAGTPMVATAAVLADELGQALGVAEMGQLSREGALRRRYWAAQRQQAVSRWAEQHGVVVTDETV